MNKKILLIAVALLAIVMLATPVLAAPTKGKKVQVTISFTRSTEVEAYNKGWTTNGEIRQERGQVVLYAPVIVTIGTDTPITTTSLAERNLHWTYPDEGSKPGNIRLIHESHVIYLPGGTFEGNALLKFHYISPYGRGDFILEAHGVFHGTGDYEGQTINAWRESGGPGIPWEGYLLKP